jgi:carbamoyltransferase
MNILALYPAPYDHQIRHDYNATIISGQKVYSYEESKLTSLKNENTSIFPERSMLLGLKELNLIPEQIDKIVLPIKAVDDDSRIEKALFWDLFKFNKNSDSSFDEWKKATIVYLPHHTGHIESAVYCSGLNETAFLSMDGGGDWGDERNFVFGEYKNKKISIIAEDYGLRTIASFHALITDSIGFNGGDNGKTSGLAGYGSVKPELVKILQSYLSISPSGIAFNRKRFQRSDLKISRIDPSAYDRAKYLNSTPSQTNVLREVVGFLPQDIAATGEYVLQISILELLRLLRTNTKMSNIVLTGGLFQNVALNNAILESNLFENVYVPMAPSDAGLSLGFAIHMKNQLSKKAESSESEKEISPFLGPSFSEAEVLKQLNDHRVIHTKLIEPEKTAAELISKGNVLGWFQGRAEFGPRSLGARSILADPRFFESKSRVNLKLKKRDWFMPYAPSILEEFSEEWLENSKFSPYMQFALRIKSDKRVNIPAAVHVDGTSRVHSVRKEWNPKYWNLINEFYRLTEIPLVLNTSFNRHGISTISTPKQAIEHLLSGNMDFLIIDDYLVSLEENRKFTVETEGFIETEKEMLGQMVLDRYRLVLMLGNDKEIDNYMNDARESGFNLDG